MSRAWWTAPWPVRGSATWILVLNLVPREVSLRPRDLAQLLWALATWIRGPRARLNLAFSLEKVEKSPESATAHHFRAVLRSCRDPKVMELAASAVPDEFQPLDVANTLWAPAHLEVHDEKLIERLVGKAWQGVAALGR